MIGPSFSPSRKIKIPFVPLIRPRKHPPALHGTPFREWGREKDTLQGSGRPQKIDVVNIEDRARTAISLGESHFREFKSALEGPPGRKAPRSARSISKDIAEALVAFANADGGELLIGVEDDGTISGINSLPVDQVALLETAPVTHVHGKTPLVNLRFAALTIDGMKLLYFSILKSSSHVHLTADGRCVQRHDLETVPIPPEDILLGRRERESREYDRGYVDGATAGDLNTEFVRAVAGQLSVGMSVEKCLQYLDLAEYIGPGLRLRRAALLLFAKEPTRWHPRLQIRILKVEGNELKTGALYNVKSDQTVTGNIVELIEKGWEGLRPQLVQTRLSKGARFESTVMYPELACREALVNAIAHRDYSDEGRGIEIYVFDDRMEVRNPGALLSSIRIQDLLRLEGVHQSRNAMVCRVLRELGYMRELGEGMRRMFELMRNSELSAPQVSSEADSFRVTLHHNTIYTPEQALWLGQFDAFGLTREQKAIIVLGINGRLVSPQDIWENLGLVDTEHYRQLVRSLQELRILTSEIPKAKAQQSAREQRKGVREIPRFRISVPRKTAPPAAAVSTAGQTDVTDDTPDQSVTVWLGNLPREVTKESLYNFLSSLGTLESIRLPTTDGQARGFAFASFSGTTAEALIKILNGRNFQGRNIVVRAAIPRMPRTH